jgi:phosphate butyryltransferase
MLKSFKDLEKIVSSKSTKMKVVVAAAHDLHTLQGINEAYEKGMIEPILVGDVAKIKEIIKNENFAINNAEIISTSSDEESAKTSARLIVEGKGNVIMKGKLQTADLLREIVNKENNLRVGEVMSHVGLFQVSSYHKLFVITDGGMLPLPSLEQKKGLIDNAVNVLRSLGVDKPKVACLAAAEVVNAKIPVSVDAGELKKQYEAGEIKNCIVEGPISMDLSLDKEAVEVKGYESPVAADADVLLAPDMTSGNLFAKAFMLAGDAMMAGLIVGAKAPIVLVSRGASAEEKYWSLVFAAAVAS